MLGTPWHTCLVPKGKGVCVRPLYGRGPQETFWKVLGSPQEQTQPLAAPASVGTGQS